MPATPTESGLTPFAFRSLSAGPLNAPRPSMGERATTLALLRFRRGTMPGIARTGPTLVTGFAGQTTTLSAEATALATSRETRALLAPLYQTPFTSGRPPSLTQNSWR